MKQVGTHHKLAIASLLGCLCLSACGEKAKAETPSMEAIMQALTVEKTLSLCTSPKKIGATSLRLTKMAGLAQTPAAANSPATPATMDHSHIPVAVPVDTARPKLSTIMTPDVMSGFNLQIITENYDMSPPPIGVEMEKLMKPFIDSASGFVEGHAHLYVNGEKIQRVYGNNIHIPASLFKTGMNQLNITINNHAHMYWTTDEKQIISSLFINTSSPKLVVHQFDSFPTQSN